MTIEELKEKVKTELIAEIIEAIKNGQDSELFNAVRTKLNKEYHVIKRDVMSNDKQNNDFVLEKVMDVVSNNFGVTVGNIKSKSRKAPLPDARHVVIYVSRLLTANNISLKNVCNVMNIKHCTGIHGVKKVKGLIETNKVFKSRIDDIIGLCKQELEC